MYIHNCPILHLNNAAREREGRTMTIRLLRYRIGELVACHPVWVGLVLRVWLAWFLPWLLDDGRYLPGVAYTDIDL